MVSADACIGQFATVVIMAQCVSVLQFGIQHRTKACQRERQIVVRVNDCNTFRW